ncbi:dihydrofolate reductase [Legionella micdadei]|uniref:Dihydrofolate reductase n=1 Tax=Legionella micdadei TaxID=451 RepID=A0A098GKQ2_LEGMI|nr:dihydrofolate reductase [Legionella micdadei]ARG98540.1 dihydrofolate reductase [Legionella micdadei]ARH01284.1 dihydrofolate reductase [Legionella micdadei]KTD27399.1 dihydrofolate reductase FolA [Legionella micdadei]NSL19391.1 dihydrofolate reductase [Legionella micdadei]CEG62106.1 Dihydrofolate reductase type 3 [Legionella micdadei]
MTKISLIAAVDEQNGLGKDNELLCHLPADLQHFKSITMGKPVIMGRKTYESIGKPLPGRQNIVLSRHKIAIDGVQVVDTLAKALALTTEAPEIMIIGGATVYEQALPYASKIYLTIIHHQFAADVFFPELDQSIWRCDETTFRERDHKNKYDLTFCRFNRINTH